MKLRVGRELLERLEEMSRRNHLSLGEIAARCARRAARLGVDVEGVEDPGSYNGTVITVPGVELEQTVFRKLIALRLNAELKKENRPNFSTGLREGVDYLLER